MEWIIGVVILVAGGFLLNKLTEGGEDSPAVQFAQKINKSIREIPDFNAKHQYISSNYRTGILYDEERGKICLMNSAGDSHKFEIIDASEIISSEIVIDSASITRTDRGSQLMGAAVGGFVAGGAGAIIGGLSGKKHHQESAKYIKLRLVIDRASNPTRQINFLDTEAEKGSATFSSAANEAGFWHDRISVLIRRSEQGESGQESEICAFNSKSKKDDYIESMERLWALKEKGAITEEEFLDQKSKLIQN